MYQFAIFLSSELVAILGWVEYCTVCDFQPWDHYFCRAYFSHYALLVYLANDHWHYLVLACWVRKTYVEK